jgi:hypothetical protein
MRSCQQIFRSSAFMTAVALISSISGGCQCDVHRQPDDLVVDVRRGIDDATLRTLLGKKLTFVGIWGGPSKDAGFSLYDGQNDLSGRVYLKPGPDSVRFNLIANRVHRGDLVRVTGVLSYSPEVNVAETEEGEMAEYYVDLDSAVIDLRLP